MSRDTVRPSLYDSAISPFSPSAATRERVRRARAVVRSFGLVAGTRAVIDFVRPADHRRVRVPSIRHPVILRAHSVDSEVFEQVFVIRDYDADYSGSPPWILDLGAHIGLASVWLANRFPGVPLVAVEPESGNVELLRRNVRPYPQVSVVHGAVWHEADRVRVEDESVRSWEFRVVPSDDGVRAWTVGELVSQFRLEGRGLVKMDIEGAERDLFRRSDDWLEFVDELVVELHERFLPGTEEAFQDALQSRPHLCELRGENYHVRFTDS